MNVAGHFCDAQMWLQALHSGDTANSFLDVEDKGPKASRIGEIA
jgi:hypothetical protein